MPWHRNRPYIIGAELLYTADFVSFIRLIRFILINFPRERLIVGLVEVKIIGRWLRRCILTIADFYFSINLVDGWMDEFARDYDN